MFRSQRRAGVCTYAGPYVGRQVCRKAVCPCCTGARQRVPPPLAGSRLAPGTEHPHHKPRRTLAVVVKAPSLSYYRRVYIRTCVHSHERLGCELELTFVFPPHQRCPPLLSCLHPLRQVRLCVRRRRVVGASALLGCNHVEC